MLAFVPPSSATTVFEDNNGAIGISREYYTSRRAKHIDVRYHWCRQAISTGSVSLEYIASSDQLADLFTKNLPSSIFCRLRASMVQSLE